MAGGVVAALAVAAVGTTQLAAQSSDFPECVALLFYGSEPPTPESIFFIPLTWIALMLCPVLAVSFYPALDLQRQGAQCLLRTGSWPRWVASKAVWAAVMTAVIVLVYLVAAAVIAGQGVDTVDDFENVIFDAPVRPSFVVQVAAVIAAVSAASFALSLCLSPIVGVIASIVYLVCSAYLCLPWLLGNFTMGQRVGLVEVPFSEVTLCLGLCAALIAASAAACLIVLPRKDLLGQR